MEIKKTIDEMKRDLHTILENYNPDTTVLPGLASQDGVGGATRNMDAVCASIEFLQVRMRDLGAKPAVIEYIDEFVKSKYAADVLRFVLRSYGGKDLTREDYSEISNYLIEL